MKLSIITVNYNNCVGLQKTIDSVIAQTWRDFEWIVIDGGSTDGSKELIEKYQEHFAYWCSEPDKGVYNAMNKGIVKANGDYMNFMNSGDCFHSPTILEQVFTLNRREDVLYGDISVLGKNWSYPHHLSLHYLIDGYLGHAASFIKSSLLKESGYDEKYKIISDWQKFLEWFYQRKTFFHVGLVIADYETPGISSNIELCNKERQMAYGELFGIQNLFWADESIQVQRMLDRWNSDTIIKMIERIRKHGGKRVAILYRFIQLLNASI